MISLRPVQTSGIPQLCDELGKQDAFKRAFPLIMRGTFQNSVPSGHQIHLGKDVAGYLLEINPTTAMRAYGDTESLLMIFPGQQRQGIGTQVLDLILEDKKQTFFVSSKSNLASTAFFQKQPGLKLLGETDRYRVYSRT